MPKQPVVKVRELALLLKRLDYRLERQSGSHMIYKKQNDCYIIIPVHGYKEIPTGTLHKIINDLSAQNDISREQIIKMLDEL